MNPGTDARYPTLTQQFRDRVRGFVESGNGFLAELERDIRRADQRGQTELKRDLLALRHRLAAAVGDGKRLLDVAEHRQGRLP